MIHDIWIPDGTEGIWNELMTFNDNWFASQSYRCCSFPMMTWSIRSHLAAAILLGPAVTEERAVFGIGDLMVFVTDLGTHCTHTYPIHHLTGVTMIPVWGKESSEGRAAVLNKYSVSLDRGIGTYSRWLVLPLPVLVHELLLCNGKGTKLIAKRILILEKPKKRSKN